MYESTGTPAAAAFSNCSSNSFTSKDVRKYTMIYGMTAKYSGILQHKKNKIEIIRVFLQYLTNLNNLRYNKLRLMK